MLTDLVQIRRLEAQKRTENQRFRLYLSRHDYSDKRLRRMGEEIEDQIDCTACANCCRETEVELSDRDVEKLSKFIGVSINEFRRDYTARDAENNLILKRTETGCVFLKDNLCTVYEGRPRDCANFPHLVRGEGSIGSRMWRMLERAGYCPIVYNWMEEVKKEVGFKTR